MKGIIVYEEIIKAYTSYPESAYMEMVEVYNFTIVLDIVIVPSF
jgi:hypothetical protein